MYKLLSQNSHRYEKVIKKKTKTLVIDYQSIKHLFKYTTDHSKCSHIWYPATTNWQLE